MPRPYPAEFRARAIALVRAGKPQKQTAEDLGIHPVTLSKWIKQDDIDRGERPGVPTGESAELRAARRRIRGWTVRAFEPVTVHRNRDGVDVEMSFWLVDAQRASVDSAG